MGSRLVWLPTWLQPPAALVVILVGWSTNEHYPAGRPGEDVLLLWLGAVTLPGLVTVLVDAVRRTRSAASSPGASSPRLRVVLGRVGTWALLQAVLALGLGVVLGLTPVDRDWAMLPLAPMLVCLVALLVLVLARLAELAASVLRIAWRGRDHEPLVHVPKAPDALNARRPLVFRALLVALGVSLLGLVAFVLPYAVVTWPASIDPPFGLAVLLVGEEAVRGAGVHVAWLWALRLTLGTAVGGVVCMAVLSPIAWWTMVLGPRVARRRAARTS